MRGRDLPGAVDADGSTLVREAGREQFLALLTALAAVRLSLAEELRKLIIAVTLGIGDVGLETKCVAERLLGEPHDVVGLVLGPGDLAALVGLAHLIASHELGWWFPTTQEMATQANSWFRARCPAVWGRKPGVRTNRLGLGVPRRRSHAEQVVERQERE